jgi:hypothetical protein
VILFFLATSPSSLGPSPVSRAPASDSKRSARVAPTGTSSTPADGVHHRQLPRETSVRDAREATSNADPRPGRVLWSHGVYWQIRGKLTLGNDHRSCVYADIAATGKCRHTGFIICRFRVTFEQELIFCAQLR